MCKNVLLKRARGAILAISLVMVSAGCQGETRTGKQSQSDKKASEQTQVEISNIDVAPAVSAKDAQYAGVFKLLDGRWKGEFKIYVHEAGQTSTGRPGKLDPAVWTKAPYRLQQSISVEQHYSSSSPYFQKVAITDSYGDGKVITSRGVNKVQDGRILCVVKKPDDLVIHDGELVGSDTIIWSRNRKSPLSIEYFRETVSKNEYTIYGWGYYGDADPKKSPTHYFAALYKRVN